MQAQWYYAEDGKSVGPQSADAIRKRIGLTKSRSLLVWAEGMSGWAEACQTPEFADSSEAAAQVGADAGKLTLAQRARKELIQYFGISAYLYICFGALIAYKAAILHDVGIEFAPYGLALVKALISGKFVMLLHVARVGERGKGDYVLLTGILRKSWLFAVFLIALTFVEEFIVGAFHGKEAHEILSEIAGGTVAEVLAVGVLLFLIMIPYFAYREIAPDLLKARG